MLRTVERPQLLQKACARDLSAVERALDRPKRLSALPTADGATALVPCLVGSELNPACHARGHGRNDPCDVMGVIGRRLLLPSPPSALSPFQAEGAGQRTLPDGARRPDDGLPAFRRPTLTETLAAHIHREPSAALSPAGFPTT
jgi:hypothetical protein